MKKLFLFSLAIAMSSFFVLKAQNAYKRGLECDKAPVLCGLTELDGLEVQHIDFLNPTGPQPALCLGQGLSHNTTWWAFVGNGEEIEIEVQVDQENCEFKGSGCPGLQIGIVKNCEGDAVDCNAECKSNDITLKGQTDNCKIYYIWVDGCCGDVCPFTFRIKKGLDGAGKIPQPLPEFEATFHPDDHSLVNVCIGDLGLDCNVNLQWSIDGEHAPDFDNLSCINDFQMGNDPVEFCVSWSLGNTIDNNSLCDQQTKCFTLSPEIATITARRFASELQMHFNQDNNSLVIKNPGVVSDGKISIFNTQSSQANTYRISGQNQSIGLNQLSAGTYIAIITSGSNMKSYKFVKW